LYKVFENIIKPVATDKVGIFLKKCVVFLGIKGERHIGITELLTLK